MIRCVDVHKAYRMGDTRVEALRGVDMEIPSPGYSAIMGPSGSGKSTLLHLLGALDVPDSGEVHVAGRRIDTLGERELTRFRRREVGIVFQQFNLIPTMSARQNVELPGVLAGESPRDVRRRADELIDALGMGHRVDHRPDALSGGEQQRIAIARSLYFSPSVLFADEPTGNLDSRSSEQLWTLLGDVAREHEMTVVMVTHEPAAAVHCERVFLLHDGRDAGVIETDGMDVGDLAAEYQRAGRA